MIATIRFIAVYAVLIAAGLFVHLHKEIRVPLNTPLTQFPVQVGGWKMTSQSEFGENILNVLKPTDYLARDYIASDGSTIQLYVGYHGGGKGSGEIHSPKHCLPGSGWYQALSRTADLTIAGKPLKLVQAVYQKGDEKQLFLYWFQVRDRSLSNEYALKIAQIVNSMTSRRRDASFIRISMPVKGSVEQTIAVGERYVQEVYPSLMRYLPQ